MKYLLVTLLAICLLSIACSRMHRFKTQSNLPTRDPKSCAWSSSRICPQ